MGPSQSSTMDDPMAWLEELSQIPLTTSGITLASVARRYVRDPMLRRVRKRAITDKGAHAITL